MNQAPDATATDDKARPKASLKVTSQQFWAICKAFFASERRKKARGFLITLVALSFLVAAVQVLMSYANRDFMTAITKKDEAGYWKSLSWFLATFGLAVPIGVYYRWMEERLALFWREWMAQHLIKRYFFNRAYYKLRGSESIDNPDQRISEDVRNFTMVSLSFLLILLNSTVTLIAFISVLWSISITLVVVLFAYAAGGTVLSILIGRRLVGLYYHQYQKEADFRYGLVRVRDNAESIAFYRGEKREHLDLVKRLDSAVRNMMRIIGWNRNLAFFTNSYNYAAIILPVVVVAPMYMRDQVDFGVVTQAAGAFAQVLAAMSLIITQFERLSAYVAGVTRLGALWEGLDEFDAEELRDAEEANIEVDDNSKVVKLENVSVRAPGSDTDLVKDLTFTLKRGQSLLIMGESGTGKSSLLRVIAGLWQGGSGSLERPALREIMFLPQRPYMIEGNLRDQLLYPYPDKNITDDQLRKVMEEVNLQGVLDRVHGNMDSVVDWTNILSLGEQQRVAFARLFLRKPRFAFLDEATSALDEANQERLYRLLKEEKIGCISVGHRTTLIAFHERVIQLDRDGSWKVTAAAKLREP